MAMDIAKILYRKCEPMLLMGFPYEGEGAIS